MLAEHGAVSREVAAAMAEGACRLLHADCALSTTGVAGPSGGSEAKPVGLVYIGSMVGGVTEVERLHFPGRREHIRERPPSPRSTYCVVAYKSSDRHRVQTAPTCRSPPIKRDRAAATIALTWAGEGAKQHPPNSLAPARAHSRIPAAKSSGDMS